MSTYLPPTLPPQHDRTAPALRVASTIGIVKWIIVALYSIVGFVGFLGALATLSDDGAAIGVVGAFFGLLVAGALALVTWVMFGWAQHTLAMLAVIARNTERH